MRKLVIFSLFLIVLLSDYGQNAVDAGTSLPKNPHEFLEAVAPLYDFSSPEIKPWHIKVTYQLYDLEGRPSRQGTWDYWWASPKIHRSTWTREGSEHSVWQTADGVSHLKDSGDPLGYFERYIGTIFFSPLHSLVLADSSGTKLDMKMFPPNQPKLACISLTPYEQYCFDISASALVSVYSYPFLQQFSQIVKAQGHYLARHVEETANQRKLLTGSVETIDYVKPQDAVFDPPADATTVSTQAVSQPGKVMAGSLVRKVPPVYPVESKMAHEQGVVVLAAVIGTDGRIQNLDVVASPSQGLAASALNCVKQWRYKPYMLNGVPVAVNTLINMIFTLGH